MTKDTYDWKRDIELAQELAAEFGATYVVPETGMSVASIDTMSLFDVIERVREHVAVEIEEYHGPSPWDLGIASRAQSTGHWVSSEDAVLAAKIARGVK